MNAENARKNKRTTSQLQEALEHAENIVSTIREPLLVLDADLRIISANQSFYRTFSTMPDETEGKLIFEAGNGQWNIPKLRELLENILPQNTSFENYEVDHEFPNFGRRILLLNARRVHDGARGGGKTQKILLAIEDITERKRMAEGVTFSELRYRRLFETAQDGILILNAQTGQITDVNPFLLNMLGYSNQDLVGKRLWEIGFFKDAEASRQAFRVLQDKGYIRYEDLPLETRDGQPMQVEFVSNSYKIDGEMVIQCNIRDITDRKRIQDRLLAYERLAAIGELSGGIAHELRNPLATLDSSIFLLKKILPDADERVRTILTRMGLSVGHCLSIIESLLNLTQMGEPHRQTLDLVRFVAALLSSNDIPGGVNVVRELPQERVMVEVDRDQLDIALGNIVTNAMQALDGKGTLTVAMRTRNSTAELTFVDDGPGIAKENMHKMFQPLFTTKAKGIGLGLAITKLIIEKHGGTIQVKSGPGQGAEFVINLPLAAGESTEHLA